MPKNKLTSHKHRTIKFLKRLILFSLLISSLYSCSSMQINPNDDLIPGERIIHEQATNAVIKIDDYGLLSFFRNDLRWIDSLIGMEAIGGWIYITNYRIIFKSHSINRVTGKLTIFLPNIINIANTSFLFRKAVTINTKYQTYEFVIWQVPHFIDIVNSEKNQLSNDKIEELKKITIININKVGDGLEVNPIVSLLSQAVFSPELITTKSKNKINASNILNIIQLYTLPKGQ